MENREYSKNLIDINKLFYKKEHADLLKKSSKFFQISEELCVFRPSYFFGTGLQIIFGQSSLMFAQIKNTLFEQNSKNILNIYNQLLQHTDNINISLIDF